MKKFGIILLSMFGTGAIVYVAGPRPNAPKLEAPIFSLPEDLETLEHQIKESERETKGIRPSCEAKIVWADSTRKIKTKLSFLYLHGGTSTSFEGDPVHKSIAKKYNANLYLARLTGHGVDLGDSTLANVTTDDFVNSAEQGLAIAKMLGEEVIVMGTSFGGALATYLASKHPEIKAIVLYSPCIKTYDERTGIFLKPWGLELIKLMSGSETFDFETNDTTYMKYWTTHYHLNFIAQFQNFLTYAMNDETFEKVRCPVFMGYWYKNENEHDTTASVPAMLEMFNKLSSASKQKQAFPNAGNHCLTSPVLSKDVEAVERETEIFLNRVFKPQA